MKRLTVFKYSAVDIGSTFVIIYTGILESF